MNQIFAFLRPFTNFTGVKDLRFLNESLVCRLGIDMGSLVEAYHKCLFLGVLKIKNNQAYVKKTYK